jgi:hypothetical protein
VSARDELLALLGRVGADETASSFAFVSAVAAGIVPSSAPPVTYGELCECRHLAQEHKHDGELTLCLGDTLVLVRVGATDRKVPMPCACRTWRRVQPPLSAFRPEEGP